MLSQSLTMFLSNLAFEDFYKISFDIVLRYSRNKVKVHLKPLHNTISLFESKSKDLIRRRLRHWNNLTKTHNQYEEIKQCSDKTKTANRIQKRGGSNYHLSMKGNNYGTYQDDLVSNQNTTMNSIMRLMQANRINNLNNHYSSKRNNTQGLKYNQSHQSFVKANNTSNNIEVNDEELIKESSFSITRIMEKCPEMSFNKERIPFSSFETYNDNNITVRTLNKPTNEQETISSNNILMNRSKSNKSNSNLIDEFYVDYLNKERLQQQQQSSQQKECFDKHLNENASLKKANTGNEERIYKTKSLDYYSKH